MGRPVLEFKTSGNTAGNVTTFDATVHDGTVNANDILFILVGNDGPGDTVNATAGGYAVLSPSPARANAAADNGAGTMLWRRAAGGDDATPTVTIDSSEGAAWVGGRISGVPTDVDPEIAVLAGAVSSINPDPPSLDPSWDATAIPTLWGMFYVWDGNVSHVGYPSTFTENQITDRWANTGGFGIAFATLPAADSDVASVNPGTGEISGSDQWASFTIAFPGTAGGGSPTTFTPAPVALTLTNPAPTVPLALSLAPAPVAATSAVPAPSVQLALNLAPAPVVTTPTVPAPSIPLALNLAPDPVAIVSAVPNSVLDAPTPTTFTPDPVALLLAEPAPTLGLTLTLAPAPVPIVLTDPAPTLGGELLLSPDPVAVTPAVPAPSLPLALTLAPAPVGVTPVVPAPSLPSSLSLTPDPVPIVLSVPEPSFGSGGDTVFTPDPVVLLLSVPGPTFEAAEPSRIKTRVAMTTEESAPGVPLWGANTVTTDLVPGQNDIAIENLVAGLTYYVKVWNEDTFGNRSSERTQVIRSETPKRLVPLTFSANGVLDQTSPMYIYLKVPTEVTEVQSAKVTFAFREFVANATAAEAVGAQTSDSGGGATSGASSSSSSSDGNGSGTMSAEPDHTHSHGDPVTGGGGDHGHTFTPAPHAHNIAHTHSTPNHQHTVPGHGHALTYGTFEETYPVSHSCVLRIYKRVGGSWGSPVYTQSGITADLWDKSLLGIISGPGDWRISIQSSGGTPQGGRLGCDVFGVLNVVM